MQLFGRVKDKKVKVLTLFSSIGSLGILDNAELKFTFLMLILTQSHPGQAGKSGSGATRLEFDLPDERHCFLFLRRVEAAV
jgi:hypothetical protein